MSKELPPFTCTYTPGFAQLLAAVRSSVAISTYQAGKVIFLSPKNEKELIQFPRSFRKPMGIAWHDNRLAIATQNEVVVFQNNPGQAHRFPKKPNTYDAVFIPRATYYTGELDIHDLQFSSAGLGAVNTRFSCLATIDDRRSFSPIWKPAFIKDIGPGDFCHLNGMATTDKQIKYLTALGATSTEKGWKPGKATGGVLIEADTQRLILRDLPMPHSPRIYSEGLFLLLSGTGELVQVDAERSTYQVIHRFDGFARGLDRIGDYLFVGLSRLRTTSVAFGDLPIASRSLMCGVVAFHLPSRTVVGQISYESSVDEIFDVRVIPGIVRPNILSIEKNEHDGIIVVPDGVYWPRPDPTLDDQV